MLGHYTTPPRADVIVPSISGACQDGMRDIITTKLVQEALFLASFVVSLQRFLNAVLVGYFGDRHVPPAVVARNPDVLVDANVDHRAARLVARPFQGRSKLLRSSGGVGNRSQAGAICREVDWNQLAV